MANETGIYKLKDGGWGFRYTISVCGKRKDVKRVRDAYGNPMKTKRDAVLARAEAMKAEEIPQQIRIVRKSVKEVYQEFCENGRKDRAYRTKQKQDSELHFAYNILAVLHREVIIATSTRQTSTLAFQRVNFHLNFHKASTPHFPRNAKKRKLISQLPLENRLICKGIRLT